VLNSRILLSRDQVLKFGVLLCEDKVLFD